jgi:hypothetical protein
MKENSKINKKKKRKKGQIDFLGNSRMQPEKKNASLIFSLLPKGPFDTFWKRHDNTFDAIRKKWSFLRKLQKRDTLMVGLCKKHMALYEP